MIKNVDKERWLIAQKSEEEFWNEYTTDSLLKESGDRYPIKAKIVTEEWSKFKKLGKNIKVLQIGSGPEDIISYLPFKNKYAIDPLAEFYRKKFSLNFDTIHLKKGTGEEIPFPDKTFDIVIIINVLDHVHLPQKVMDEIKRVLKKDGLFHFENYFYQENFIRIAKFFGKAKEVLTREIFNIHHPYMFNSNELHNLISSNFSILKEETGRDIGIYDNQQQLKAKILNHKKFSRRLLARFGLLGTINYSAICKN